MSEKKFGDYARSCPKHDYLTNGCLYCIMEINKRSPDRIKVAFLFDQKDEQLTKAQERIEEYKTILECLHDGEWTLDDLNDWFDSQ